VNNVGEFKRQPATPPPIEICILAGGASKRMGHDKSRLRFGRATMLGLIRKTARATGLPVRVIRHDCIPKRGPLSGIYTALKNTPPDAVLFLACDMPLVTTELIQFILRRFAEIGSRIQPVRDSDLPFALFVRSRRRAGFPFILSSNTLLAVERQIQSGDYSLQGLAEALRAAIVSLPRPWARLLVNVNTPKDWALARTIGAPRPALEVQPYSPGAGPK
jgi:molybdopterin-guanine dinucleotide biosynthesis protein A